MRTYRIELIGEELWFATYFQANNEHDAKQNAKKTYPMFSLGQIVEVMDV